MKYPILSALFTMTIALGATRTSAIDDQVLNDSNLKLEVQQVSDDPLPYQAVRIRLLLTNTSDRTLGPIQPVEEATRVWVSLPGEPDRFKGFNGIATPFYSVEGHTTAAIRHLDFLSRKVPLKLGPGEQTSVTLTLACNWERTAEGKLTTMSVFPEPGEYRVQCRYMLDSEEKKFLEATIKVRVRKPEGEVRKIVELLGKDKVLATAIMMPFGDPDKPTTATLKDIIKRHPQSSYVNYARFALARAYWVGHGIDPEIDSSRVQTALRLDELDRIIGKEGDGPFDSRLVAFAYGPYVLVEATYWNALDRVHPDALEWIEVLARMYYEDRRRVEELLKKKFPPRDPCPVIGNKEATENFIAETWSAYRKRAPSKPAEPKK